MKKYKENELIALNNFVGSSQNIKTHTNCMTRFRFTIINKDLVNTNEIKKLSFVRGVNWAGNELQVIIGTDVMDVRSQYMDLFPNTNIIEPNNITDQKATLVLEKHKFSFKKTITGFISNVIVPIIPALMAAGIMQAFYSILITSKALVPVDMKDITAGKIGTDIPIISGVFFLISDIGLKFLGLLIGFNTIRYLGGKNVNLVMAVLIPLILAAPHLFPGTTWTLYSFATIVTPGKPDFDVGIKIMGYSSMFLPQIGAGIIYVYLDRWIKTWMPSVVDLVFRHFLCLLTVGLITFFGIGPVLGLIESGIYYAITYISQVPYGIGNGIFGFFWTFLVLSGTHASVAVAIQNQLQNQIYNGDFSGSQLVALHSITSMTTVATCLAVTIRAKEANMKKIAFGSLMSGAFGVSEPTYYSISMLRPILFVPVIIARALGGIFIGVLDIRAYQPGGRGVLAWTVAINENPSINSTTNLLKMIGAMAFVFSVCFALTLVMYQERKSDRKILSKLYSKILKTFKSENQNTHFNYKQDLLALQKQVSTKEYKQNMKDAESIIVQENNLKFKLLRNEDKLDLIKTKSKKKNINIEKKILLFQNKDEKLKANKAKQELIIKNYKKEVLQKNKLNKINKLINDKIIELNQKKSELNLQLVERRNETKKALQKIEKYHLQVENKIKKSFNPLLINANQEEQEKINKQIFNSVHNLEINYKLIDKQEI